LSGGIMTSKVINATMVYRKGKTINLLPLSGYIIVILKFLSVSVCVCVCVCLGVHVYVGMYVHVLCMCNTVCVCVHVYTVMPESLTYKVLPRHAQTSQ